MFSYAWYKGTQASFVGEIVRSAMNLVCLALDIGTDVLVPSRWLHGMTERAFGIYLR